MALRIAILTVALGMLAACQRQVSREVLPDVSFNQPGVVAPADSALQAPIVQVPQAPATQPAAVAESPTESNADGWLPGAQARPWQWIVIHHSATQYGNAQIIDGWHKGKGWDELGYHFVIDNGNGGTDGRVEVGPRWVKQKWGAHTKTADNRFNDFGIGICLVGNFDVDHPSEAQMQSLAKLVAYLMKTYHVPAERVLGHSDAKPTDCPGRFMNVAEVRQRASQLLAESGEVSGELAAKPAASAEMLK